MTILPNINGTILESTTTITKQLHDQQVGLSWGSVQAEKVRLQKHNESGLMDIYLKFPV